MSEQVYGVDVDLDEKENTITINVLFHGEPVERYKLTDNLIDITDGNALFHPFESGVIRQSDQKEIVGVFTAIQEDLLRARFPDYQERLEKEQALAKKFKDDSLRNLVTDVDCPFVDVTDVLEALGRDEDTPDLWDRMEADVEWAVLRNLHRYGIDDRDSFSTIFFVNRGEIAYVHRYDLNDDYHEVSDFARYSMDNLYFINHALKAGSGFRHLVPQRKLLESYLGLDLAQEEMASLALSQMDAASQEWDPERLDWELTPELPLDVFRDTMTEDDWKEMFWTYDLEAMEEGRGGYREMLAGRIIDPVVVVLDENGEREVDIWDGWHRIAASIVRGEKSIRAITARSYKPALTPTAP